MRVYSEEGAGVTEICSRDTSIRYDLVKLQKCVRNCTVALCLVCFNYYYCLGTCK